MNMKKLLVCLGLLLLAACNTADDPVPTEFDQNPDIVAERGKPEPMPTYSTDGNTLSNVTSQSAKRVIYGPIDYARQKGKPVATADTFSTSPGDYTLVVVNGPESANRSSSTVIRINGEDVVSPDEFNQQVGLITKEIELEAQNEVSVEVRGKPGSIVRLQIEGEQLPFKIGGEVTTADGEPVGNADVELSFDSGETYQTLTDSGGLFAFTDFAAEGPFTLEATSSNNLLYGSVTGSISADLPQIDVTLIAAKRGPGTITGTVLSSTGETVTDAAITVVFSETSFTASTTSDANGYFDLSGLPADGSFSVTAFDKASVTSGSEISFITASNPTRDLTVTLDAPPVELTNFSNGGFADGTLSGWQTEGSVQIVSKSDAFPSTLGSTSLQTQASSYAAVASTAGDSRSVGRMKQPFLVGSCHTRLQGKVRFLSSEWPTYYGTEYNDAYIVKLVTPSGANILAQGNLNSSSWSGGLLGYGGKTPVIEVDVDVSAFAGSDSPLTLDIKVSDVGDMVVDSAMAVADFQVVDGDAFNLGSQSLGALASGDKIKLSDITFEAPSVLSYVMPDDFVPAGVSTPYTFEQEDSLIVVTRESDLQKGAVTFEVPVQAIGSGGEPINFTSDKKVSFLNTESEPTQITNGVARVPVTIPAGSGLQDINLNNIEINAEDGISTQSADRCEAVVPINFTGELPNQQVGSDVGEDIAGWFGDLGLDWETTAFALKFIYDLIPLLGDGTELIGQLVNYLTGKGVDEVSATLAAIGFALDFPTDPATIAAGGVVSGSKSIYKLSQKGAGTLAEVIHDIVTGSGTAREKVQALKDTVGTFVDLFFKGGISATRNADEVAKAVLDGGVNGANSATEAVTGLRKGLDNLKNNPNSAFSGIDFDQSKLLEAANEFKNIPGAGEVSSGPIYDLVRGNGVGAYTELVGTKGLKDKGHSILEFDNKSFTASDGKSFDIDSLTTYGGKTYANQAKARLTDPAKATTFANRMNDWVNVDPGNRVGQYVFLEANPSLLPRNVYDAIKAVNPDIRIVDVNGNTIPRP